MRLIALVVAIAATWLGIPQFAAAVVAPATPTATYNYDGCYCAAVAADLATERGPPSTGHHYTPYDGAHRWSHGARARLKVDAIDAYTGYDTLAVSARTVRGGTTTEGQVGRTGDLSPLAPSGVAANAGDDVTRLYRAVDPDELKDIVGTGVYRSAPGGTEGKYFFPTKAQAENFSNLMGKTGTGPYCITSGCIPRSTLNGIETISPAGEGTAYFIPQNLLPQFRDIIIHGPQ